MHIPDRPGMKNCSAYLWAREETELKLQLKEQVPKLVVDCFMCRQKAGLADHAKAGEDKSGVVPDCHGVTQNGSGSSSVTSPALVLVETPNEPVCGGTVVSTKMNGGNRFALLWPDAENTKGVILGNNTIPILKSQQTTVFLPVVYIFIFIVGLPTNAMAIWVFLFRTKKKNPTSILMANLALADLLFIVWLPLKVAYHLNGNDWIFGESLCRVLVGFFYGNMYCSTIFIACISAQRYWTVAHPLSHKLNTRVTACVCVGVWVVVWLITVPLYLYEQTVKVLNLNTTTCHDVTRRNQTHFPVGYFLTMGIMGYVVPCVVCVVAYLLTFRSLSRSVTDPSNIKKKRRAVILMIIVLVMFLVCFTPSNILLMVHYFLLGAGHQNEVYRFYVVVLCLGSLNSCLDPFVYYFISEEFRKHLRTVLKCHNQQSSNMAAVCYRPVKPLMESPKTSSTPLSTRKLYLTDPIKAPLES
ncbi:hypothetical protein NFI96_009568 [Prochilodus magdalenae]|nr:hypothetical protein NFI96_009568 [Prochilodus magdalenae]